MGATSSPDVSGIKASVATVTNGVVSTTVVAVGHVDSLGELISKSRSVQKYTPINNTQNDEIVSLGPLSQAAFTMGVLYDPEATEGIITIETAINTNAQIQLIIELSNAKTTNGKGTTYKQIVKCSDFKVPLPKDGKLVSNFTAERIGLATIVAAS